MNHTPVKVLDFGLAKAIDTMPEGDPSGSPTLTAAATQMGVILGTAAYMSPEQARGTAVDRSSDVWSFGVVLYEMLVGKSLFEAASVSDTVAAVLREKPDWDALPRETPSAVRRLLRRCLEPDKARRLRHVGVARLEIDAPPDDMTVLAPQPKMRRWAVLMPVVALFAAAVGATLALTLGAPRMDAPLVGGAFPMSRSRAHTHRRHGHPLQTVPSAGLIERPPEKNRVDALR